MNNNFWVISKTLYDDVSYRCVDVRLFDICVRLSARVRRGERFLPEGSPTNAAKQFSAQAAEPQPQPRRRDSTRTGS